MAAGQPTSVAGIETAVDQSIAACDGDARAAVRALIIAIGLHEEMIGTLQRELADAVQELSQGFTRGRFRRTAYVPRGPDDQYCAGESSGPTPAGIRSPTLIGASPPMPSPALPTPRRFRGE